MDGVIVREQDADERCQRCQAQKHEDDEVKDEATRLVDVLAVEKKHEEGETIVEPTSPGLRTQEKEVEGKRNP